MILWERGKKFIIYLLCIALLGTYIVLDVVEVHVLCHFRHTNPRSPGQPPPPPPQSNTYAHRHLYQQELQQYNNQVYFSAENFQYLLVDVFHIFSHSWNSWLFHFEKVVVFFMLTLYIYRCSSRHARVTIISNSSSISQVITSRPETVITNHPCQRQDVVSVVRLASSIYVCN